jgi:hypothetical protein
VRAIAVRAARWRTSMPRRGSGFVIITRRIRHFHYRSQTAILNSSPIERGDQMSVLLLTLVLAVVPAAAIRYGTDSRPGFSGRVDWRELDS